MYKEKKVCIVVPAYNEEKQIAKVVETMPEYVDRIVIVNDRSKDKTAEAVRELQTRFLNVELINHEFNQGVGGAIATGYMWARDNNMDVAVVMAGDAQMDPADLPSILDPVVSGEVDYSKGNRLFTGEAYKKIPKTRYFGNSALSLFTKIASGYWHVADSQTGYTAISKKALHTIEWKSMYKRYGQPNDLLCRLNVYDFKVRDVPVKPVYNVGEKSGIKIRIVLFTIPWLLFKLFIWRMKEKYVIRNFHPLVLFYLMGVFFTLLTLYFAVRLVFLWADYGYAPTLTALATLFSFTSAAMFTLFAMWFDMETNKELK